MELALIWAMSRNRVIGRDNDLPWHLPAEMKHFMRTTRGHPVIMGRHTFESMPGPLPHRTNIVVTRRRDYPSRGIIIVGDLPSAVEQARQRCEADGVNEAFISGGAELYRQGLEIADRLYMTEVDAELDGDTFFPEVDWSQWRLTHSEHHAADARNAYGFTIKVLERA